MTQTSLSPALFIIGLVALLTAGCLDPDPPLETPWEETTTSKFDVHGCYLFASHPEMHLYGCGEKALSARLAPGETVTESLQIENLTGFTLRIEAEPLATGTFHISVGSFKGAIDIRAGKWLADTARAPPETTDRFRALIDECDASSVTVSFVSDVALPASLDVALDSHADHRRFMTTEDGAQIDATCTSNWSHTSWPV